MQIRSCAHCQTEFKTSNKRRVFCSDRCKTAFNRQHSLTCFYCGTLAGTKDHIFPQKHGEGVGDVVCACAECNSILNACEPLSVVGRMEHLIYTFVKRHKVNKHLPQWTEQELASLSINLKEAVQYKIVEHKNNIARWLHMVARLKQL